MRKRPHVALSRIKNHSFSDGNKRIAAFLFLWFLEKNGILYKEDNTPLIANNTLVALTLMIAESNPEEILSGYVAKDDLIRMHIYISRYAQGNMGDIPQKISSSGVDNFDIHHYGWNTWNHFDKVVGQDKTADWLINVFTELSGSKNIIYKKFKHDERGSLVC